MIVYLNQSIVKRNNNSLYYDNERNKANAFQKNNCIFSFIG